MSIGLADIIACSVGLLFPYAMFVGFRAPFNLKLDTTHARRFEKLSYEWLKPILILSGMFGAGAAYADRHSDNAFVFGVLLASMFTVFLLAVPAGKLAFFQNYGWDQRRS